LLAGQLIWEERNMRHFDFLSAEATERLFYRAPQPFGRDDDRAAVGGALGATLYCPANRPQLARDIAVNTARGVLSFVICLEDAIADADLISAETHAIADLRRYAQSSTDRPLVFVRVRRPEQVPMIVAGLAEYVDVLAGFVFPKFTTESGVGYLEAIDAASTTVGRVLLAMPVLESPEILYAETRMHELFAIKALLEKYRRSILAIRVGAVDFSACYGLRRARDLSVYDVGLLASVIGDIVNVFGRADDSGYAVTGPVWEYFSETERLFKPQLRESPFIEHAEGELRADIVARDLDGLIREIVLDKANGLTGKSVIHPRHVAAVHALLVVTREEYADATDIVATDAVGGAMASEYHNKMNESRPHSAWATRTIERARVFGVANESTSFVDLLGAGLQR
jgi:citrate lyase beta subunit